MVNIYTISDKALMGKQVNILSSYIAESFFKNNIKITKQCIFSSTADFSFLNNEDSEKSIYVFLVDKTNKNLNQTLCDITKSVIIDNPYAKNAIYEYYKIIGQPMEKSSEDEWKLPSLARVIVNTKNTTQGYMLNYKNTIYCVLPNSYDEAKTMFDDIVLENILKDQKKKFKHYTFKTFGLPKNTITTLISDELKNKNKVSINFFEKPLEIDVVVKALEDNDKLDIIAQAIFKKLDKYIYSVEDTPIEGVVSNLLKLNQVKVCFVEDITGGELCSKLLKYNSKIRENIEQSIVLLDNNIKNKFLDVNQLQQGEEVSANTAFDLAAKMISKSNANIVIATLGSIAGDDKYPSGLCYIAVGDKREIHVYKNIFKGNANEIIDNITMASYFYLVKKLKKNDFHFEKTTV